MSLEVLPFAFIIAALVSGVGAHCSRRRPYRTFALWLLLLTVVGIVVNIFAYRSWVPRLQAIWVSLIQILPLAVVYSIIPGLIVRRGGTALRVLIFTALATAIAVPTWVYYDFYVFCSFIPHCMM